MIEIAVKFVAQAGLCGRTASMRRNTYCLTGITLNSLESNIMAGIHEAAMLWLVDAYKDVDTVLGEALQLLRERDQVRIVV